MQPSDIGKAYDQITHLWEDADFNRENGIVQHKRALAFVDKPGRALDVGCGCTGRFIELLREQGFEPEGLDVSEKMLDLAKTRHPDILFHLADIVHWTPPARYDFITAWDSIWHVPLERQAQVLEKLLASLNPGGVMIFSCGAVDEAGDHKNDYMGPEVYYASLGINGFLQLIMGSGCLCRHFEYDQYPELHAYFIVQKV